MELEIKAQALCLLWGLLMGAALGLFYEFLRLCRKKWKLNAPFDAIFALGCFAAAFLYGMIWACGRLGLWEIGALTLGFYLYMAAISPVIIKLFPNAKIF